MYVCAVCETSGQAFKTVCPSCWGEMRKRAFGGAILLSKLNGLLFDEDGDAVDIGRIEEEVGRLKAIEQGLLEGLVGYELWTTTLE